MASSTSKKKKGVIQNTLEPVRASEVWRAYDGMANRKTNGSLDGHLREGSIDDMGQRNKLTGLIKGDTCERLEVIEGRFH